MSTVDATLEVSPEEDTITLSGYIPGITSESRLAFKTYDYFGSSDDIGCQAPPSQIAPASQCATDDVSDVSAAYLDITEISASLSGETLTVVFRFRDIPETLTFNRTGISENYMEYGWVVSVDVDADPETGLLGAEYSLGASHFAFSSSSSGKGVHLHLSEAVQANSWKLDPGGGGAYLSSISLEVSPEENTITLIGDVPCTTSQSRLVFDAYDYLNGSEQVACQVLSIAGDSE